jgi:HTH-type transcriptional regulator / antitoxin HigA
MGVITVSPRKYASLLTKALPKVIETDAELEHFAEMLESLDRSERGLTPEEKALRNLLARLVQDYDDRIELPEVSPLEMLKYLMEQRDLRQTDLLPVFGSRGVASAVLTGKRELSKTHIRKLAEFFHLSAEAFF